MDDRTSVPRTLLSSRSSAPSFRPHELGLIEGEASHG